MLSVTRVNTSQASTYYTKDDYYLQSAGEWYGELSSALNYMGTIKEKDFQSLVNGVDNKEKPRFSIQSGGKNKSHTAGVDLTFSAPKSVSIASLVLNDKEVIEAHNKAVNSVLNYVERNLTNVRIHENNQVRSEFTGNLLVAKFQHMSSRELDPQLHTHCLVMNLTVKENGDKRAMDFGEIYNSKMSLGQMYRSELALNLKEIGYQIKTDSRGLFEIQGFSDNLIKEFSARSFQIKEKFEELKKRFPNKDEAQLKAMATLETRKAKDEPNMEELKQNWDERLSNSLNKEEYLKKLKLEKSIFKANNINSIIEKAMQIATEKEAVVNIEDVLRVSTKIGLGEYRIDEYRKALEANQNIIKINNKNYTTFEIAQMEHKIVDIVNEGKGIFQGLDKHIVNKGINDYQISNNFALTVGQKEAINHILSSKDRIIAIQGDAGTGKTTMLDAVREIAEKENISISGLSFTGKAASEIENASSIKSKTIASIGDKVISDKLLVIDEASMLSIKDMGKIINNCHDLTKIILIGDTKQLQSIGQGKIFSSLQERGIINTVRMSEVQRQESAEYKDIVHQFSNKQINVAFERLENQKIIHEIESRSSRLEAIVKDFVTKSKESIIVTASNKDKEDLNQMIRNELIKRGEVDNKLNVVALETRNLSAEEKLYSDNYYKNDIVIANTAGIIGKAGTQGRIIGKDNIKNTLLVNINNKIKLIDLKKNGNSLQIYTEKPRIFGEGEKIIFLKNDNKVKVKNGQTAHITSIKDGFVTAKLDNKKILIFNIENQYKYVGYGYALSDYKSQGQTAKHVIYHADTNRGVSYNQAYVGVTRGKTSLSIYTDNKENLRELVKREQNKTSTLDHDISKHNMHSIGNNKSFERV